MPLVLAQDYAYHLQLVQPRSRWRERTDAGDMAFGRFLSVDHGWSRALYYRSSTSYYIC